MQPAEPIYRLPPFKVEATYVALAETVDWGLSLFKVPEQWKRTKGEGVRVAVLDTGIELDHPDVREAIDKAKDFTRSRFGVVDRQGHGTHVAGTIGARKNEQGVVGVAPECRLLIGKVLGDDGSGTDDSVAEGIAWAVDEGAQLISMSLGSPYPSQAIYQAIQRALKNNRFVVCAAGNDGRPNSVNYPARWEETVAVGAVDKDGKLARFSSQGEELDICAPGENVLSTFLNGGYAKLSGTSMATPFVSGVVTLMLAKHKQVGGRTPVNNQQQLLDHLRATATDAGATGRDPQYGYGLINAEKLLADEPVAPPVASQLEIGPIMVNGVPGTLVFVPS
ncbi:MAG: S8 family peptidase [Pirellulales bacterium]